MKLISTSVFAKCSLTSLLFGLSTLAYADLPLTVEDLIADKNRFRLDSTLSYHNQSRQGVASQGYSSVDLGNGRALYIPNPSSQSTTNSDSMILGLGLRYGVSDRLELGIKGNGIHHSQRYQDAGDMSSTSHTQLQDISLSTQYQLFKNHRTMPDGLIFGDVSLYDNTQELQNKSLANAVIGATVYTINDPIVLSLTGSYQYQGKRELDGVRTGTIDIGDTLMVNGTVGFAVNPDITLTGGVGVRYKWADKNEYGKLENDHTQTSLNLGLAYALSARSNLTANLRTNVSGDSSSTLSLGMTTKLGTLPPPLSQKYRQNLADNVSLEPQDQPAS